MGKRFSELLEKVGLGQLSAREYQANHNGLNMFFGAVLGFVLAGTEKLSSVQFGVLLLGLGSVIVTILYISSSRHRVLYSILALFYTLTFPEFMEFFLQGKNLVPDKVRPALLVWTLMTIAVEFWARGKEQEPIT